MFRKIHKLQSDVDELLALCNGSAKQEELLTPEDIKHRRLGVMLLKAQDGELPKRNFLRMEKWLMCDDQALRYYIDFQILTVLLHEHFNKNWFSKTLSAIKGYISAGTV